MIVVRHSYISVTGKQRVHGVGVPQARTLAIGTALSHVKYIQYRPGKDLEKGGREMFTDLEDSVNSKVLRHELREYGGRGVVVHKLTLSPEINASDPKEFTREVMDKLGAEKGLDLQWWSVCHRNTDHHHIHVVVMPKDRNGRFVRIDKEDYNRLKEFGDRYLERTQYADWRAAELLRQEKLKERSLERRRQYEKTRQDRIQKGEELPWLHRKIVREQLEPYDLWRKAQAADRKEFFEHQGQRYSPDDSYERLVNLRRNLNESTDAAARLSKQNYRQLQSWIEQKDRARFSGEIDRQLANAKQHQASAENSRNSPNAHRYVSPVQQELMRNPVMGLFLTEASIAAAIVRSIPLTDQRDRLKESREELESAKRDREAKQRKRRNSEQRAADEEIIQNIDEAIEHNKNVREDARREQQRKKDKRDHGLDFMR